MNYIKHIIFVGIEEASLVKWDLIQNSAILLPRKIFRSEFLLFLVILKEQINSNKSVA